MGSIVFFARFWNFYGSLGGREGSHWLRSTLRIQKAWCSARRVQHGSSFDWFWWFPEKMSWRPGNQKSWFSRFSVDIKKLLGEKLCRFVVVSPRRGPSFAFSCPFNIFHFRSCLKAPPIFLLRSSQKVYANYFVNGGCTHFVGRLFPTELSVY